MESCFTVMQLTHTKTMDTATTYNSNSGNYEASLAPTGDTTGSTYDKACNRIAAFDGKQHTTVYAFDARGRQVSITDRFPVADSCDVLFSPF